MAEIFKFHQEKIDPNLTFIESSEQQAKIYLHEGRLRISVKGEAELLLDAGPNDVLVRGNEVEDYQKIYDAFVEFLERVRVIQG